jgi:hypothetical protein
LFVTGTSKTLDVTPREDVVKISKRGKFTGGERNLAGVTEPFSGPELQMISWLYKFSERYGQISAADGVVHMQYCSREQLADQYEQRCLDVGDDVMSKRAFRRTLKKLWKHDYPIEGSTEPFRIKFCRYNAFGKCTVCISLVLEIKSTLNKARRGYLTSLLICHRHTAYEEKRTWYMVREKAISDQLIWSLGQDNIDKRKTRMIWLGSELKGTPNLIEPSLDSNPRPNTKPCLNVKQALWLFVKSLTIAGY